MSSYISPTAKKIYLPNIKLHKKSRSPENVRILSPENHSLLIESLKTPASSPSKFLDHTFRPGSIDLSSKNERIIDQTFAARFSIMESTPIRKIQEQVPTVKYGNITMSKDLAIMTQVRRNLMGEVASNKIQNLTPENFPQIRSSHYPKEFQNTGNSAQLVQKLKAVKERKNRHPYGTGAYAIKAMNPRVQKVIISKLKTSLPEGSRFFKYL